MIIHIDLRCVPPACNIEAPNDFGDLRVMVTSSSHAFVSPQALDAMVDAEHKGDGWRRSFENMLEYAEANGWANELGQIRAHVDIETSS